jgi:hypothetical protein
MGLNAAIRSEIAADQPQLAVVVALSRWQLVLGGCHFF